MEIIIIKFEERIEKGLSFNSRTVQVLLSYKCGKKLYSKLEGMLRNI